MKHMHIGKRENVILALLSAILIFATQVFAGGQNRAGTSAAPELLIPVGARYLAMAGAPVASATGVEAVFWNPAGVDIASKTANAIFSYRTYIADISFSYLAVSGRFGFGTLALSLRSLNIGDIPVTTESTPDGTGEIFSPTYFVAGLTYSRQLSDRISIGLSANVVSESFAQVSSSGIAFDVGVRYSDILAIQGLELGVAVKNIGPAMKYGGAGLWVSANASGSQRGVTLYKVEAAAFELPSVVEIGAAYRMTPSEGSQLTVSSTFQNNNFAYDEYRIGAEYSYDQMFFLRAGYLMGATATTERPDIFEKYTLGAGVSFTDVGGTDVSVDYAFVPVKFFDTNHVIALRVGF